MFWDDWSTRDVQVYGIFVALVILFLWNICLTIYVGFLKRKCRDQDNRSEEKTKRIATSPVWNQMFVPKIPRVQKVRSNPNTISSAPQTPSDWFGDGPIRMDDNIFF